VVFSAEALPFKAATFDFAYCSEVLEHLDHPENALAEMARAGLGGRCIFTVPNEVITGKLEKGHVQTFGYDSFLELIRPYVEVRHVRGLFLFGKGVTPSLTQTARGRLRFAASLWVGQWLPRRSLSILTDGILRPA
jgi:SAM-dependent methyltransferase